MKTKLIAILNQCLLNKPIHEYNSVNKFIITLEQNTTVFNTIEHDIYSKDDENTFISFWTDKHILISVLFSTNDYIAIHNDCGCHVSIDNKGSAIIYDEIKTILANK